MKIAIAINTSWNIYNFRKGLIKRLLDRGDEVVAIAPRDEYTDRLIKMGCGFRYLTISSSGMNPVKDVMLMGSLRSILKEEKPDILLTYTIKPNIYGSIVAGHLGIPCICNVSGLGTVFLWKGSVKQLATRLYSFAFKRNRWVFFQNDEDREEFLRFVNLDRQKTSLLPGSGIDIARFQPVVTEPNQRPVFLMIARLLVEKGVYDYIEAIKLLKAKGVDAEFRLIGGLDETHSRAIAKNELDEWISTGLIGYTGHLTDVRDAIALSDVVVLPSYREGTPRTLLEAGAMGRAMIATDVPGCRHVVNDGENGFLCKLKNPRDLAAKMKLYLSLSATERQQMSANARRSIVERFDEQLVIDQYLHKIDELVP